MQEASPSHLMALGDIAAIWGRQRRDWAPVVNGTQHCGVLAIRKPGFERRWQIAESEYSSVASRKGQDALN
jgi:hypothetical protein